MACVDALKKVSHSYGISIEVATIQGADIGNGKNFTITNGKQITVGMELPDFDYFFSIDDDIEFTPEQFIRILKLAEENNCIASGVYVCRNKETHSVHGRFDEYLGDCRNSIPMSATGIHECDWIGTGFFACSKQILIDMLNKTENLWFYKPVLKYKDVIYSPGMDIGFCINAKNSYIKILADFDCKVTHLTSKENVLMEQQKQQQVNIPAVLYSATKLKDQAYGLLEQLVDALVKENEELRKQLAAKQAEVSNG